MMIDSANYATPHSKEDRVFTRRGVDSDKLRTPAYGLSTDKKPLATWRLNKGRVPRVQWVSFRRSCVERAFYITT